MVVKVAILIFGWLPVCGAHNFTFSDQYLHAENPPNCVALTFYTSFSTYL